jgi:L-seryl-tRNA(Ser) seleniumtransferase
VASVGGGGAPGVPLPSAALSLPEELAGPLRTGQPPVYGRVVEGRCRLDLRSVRPSEDDALVEAVLGAASRCALAG